MHLYNVDILNVHIFFVVVQNRVAKGIDFVLRKGKGLKA